MDPKFNFSCFFAFKSIFKSQEFANERHFSGAGIELKQILGGGGGGELFKGGGQDVG